MKGLVFSFFLAYTTYVYAQDTSLALPIDSPAFTIDSLVLDSLNASNEKKEKFIDYFNLMPKAVRDYTPSDYFEAYKNLEINSIEVFVVDRFDVPVYEQDDINDAQLIQSKRGIQSSVLVRKQLLFKEGDVVDPRLVADTERNIRENTIYKDAIITIEQTPHLPGVDIKVYAHDNRHWKAIFWGTPTSLTLGGAFYDFFGVSQQLQFFGTGIIDPRNPYQIGAEYKVNNIARSQIDFGVQYNKQNQRESYGFQIDRKFFAYNTKWAGKFAVTNNAVKIENNQISNKYNNRFFQMEAWLARSFGLKKINERNPTMRMIISGRGLVKNNYAIPKDQPFQNFVNRQLYMGSIGLANRDWYGFEELYRFRQFDYVPKGFNIAYMGGYEINQILGGRVYNGLNLNYSKQYEGFGFMKNDISLGSFVRNKGIEQITLQSINSFFTNKIPVGRLGFRQFITANTTLSFNRPISEFYNIGNGAIRGFESQKLIGTKSFVLNLESVFYTNVDWWTSRGNFFFFADLGFLGRSNKDFIFNNRVYQGYGGGIRFQNLTLGIAYMEVSLAYYPNGYTVQERNFGFQIGDIPPREINPNNLFSPGVLSDIY